MRILLLLLVAGVAAYFTVPSRAAHEQAAKAFLEGRAPGEAREGELNLQTVLGYVKGMLAGQGRYENFYLASKFTLDTPGAAYVECWGGFTMVRCEEKSPGAGEG